MKQNISAFLYKHDFLSKHYRWLVLYYWHGLITDNAVLRVPILYGPHEYLAESAVTTLYNSVKDSSKPCKMDHRQRRFPTHTENVADIIHQMVDKHASNVSCVNALTLFKNWNLCKWSLAEEKILLGIQIVDPDSYRQTWTRRSLFDAESQCQPRIWSIYCFVCYITISCVCFHLSISISYLDTFGNIHVHANRKLFIPTRPGPKNPFSINIIISKKNEFIIIVLC